MRITRRRRTIIFVIIAIFIGIFIFSIGFIAVALPINSRNILALRILATSNPSLIAEYEGKYGNTLQRGLDIKVTEQDPVIVPIEFEEEELSDPRYLADHTYLVKGVNGQIEKYYYSVDFNWLGISINRTILKEIKETPPSSEKTFIGDLSSETLSSDIGKYLNFLIYELANDNNISDKSILDNLTFGNTVIEDNVQFESETAIVGKTSIKMGNCNKTIEQAISYNYKTQSWEISDKSVFISSLCAPQFIKTGDMLIGTCKDCTLFPVNKQYGLRSDYVPDVVTFDLQTNVLIAKTVFNDLRLMYKDAQSKGHSIWINSSYRSYTTQLNTFEGWVKTEIAAGKDRASAESAANSYSARAGFSEHQLGTTVDIVTTQCVSFGRGCGPSESLWSWLRENSYKYGFILSYPEDKETGYVFEPWHFRWIGRELANEYKKVESSKTLQQFLLEKNQF